MYSWEITNYLNENNYRLNFQQVRNIMDNSPQIFLWKMEEYLSDIDGYGKYHWWTTDNNEWIFYIKNQY